MTGILSQYLMRTILTSTALVLVVLLALAGLFEFIAELDDVKADYKTPQAILYAALQLPNLAFQMLPVSALIGSLLGLGGLAANSEVIVMRASGLSVVRLAGMVSLAGFVMLVATGLLGEFIGPPLDYYARNMRAEARYGDEDDRLGNDMWVKDGPVYLHLERINTEFDFGRLYVYGLLIGLAPIVGEWLYLNTGAPHHGFPITFGIAAGIMILTGLFIFVRLLHDNPVPVEGAPSENG